MALIMGIIRNLCNQTVMLESKTTIYCISILCLNLYALNSPLNVSSKLQQLLSAPELQRHCKDPATLYLPCITDAGFPRQLVLEVAQDNIS